MSPSEKPTKRILRGYAFDPSLSLNLDTFIINEIEYVVPWEELNSTATDVFDNDAQVEGISGEYIEIIDYDPTILKPDKTFGVYYKSVDLDSKLILANNGLNPSESNPLFHQQMVYAVAMTTIKNFEKALGRKVLWADKNIFDEEGFVKQLRIYPHALKDANAFYSPAKKAILFGYFKARPAENHLHMPNSQVFTCLSHDIIAHEITHAILDGMKREYNTPTNPDVHAFHEAFADIVALFQRFTFVDVLKHQIGLTRGDLSKQNLLGQLAKQMGTAIGQYGSLRDYLGQFVDGEWVQHEPSTEEYKTVLEPHARGSILVAAMFEAFINVYKRRTRDLFRIASNGTGILPDGDLHPDLVNRLSKDAAKTAKHFLNICIRAIDYCPPVDITFGDYLRAVITADCDLVSNDVHGYRLAIIEAFKRRGIYPNGIKNLSIESLRFKEIDYEDKNLTFEDKEVYGLLNNFLERYIKHMSYISDRELIHKHTKAFIVGESTIDSAMGLHSRMSQKLDLMSFAKLIGIYYGDEWKKNGIHKSRTTGKPSFVIDGLRLITRVGPNGTKLNQVVFSITQTARFKIKFRSDGSPEFIPTQKDPNIRFSGGATLIFDINTSKLKYCISKPLVKREGHEELRIDKYRLKKQFDFSNGKYQSNENDFASYFNLLEDEADEPFALLHNH